jgi:uncharacterized DUF497 family protein
MVRISRVLWDEWNEDHIARHGVDRTEAEEVVLSEESYITKARRGTYRVVGQTIGGRFLTVVVSPRGDGVYYVVTARNADSSERRALREH